MAHILLVENDSHTLKAVQQTLRQAGHLVATALDGPTALRALGSSKYDLVLTDIQMSTGPQGHNLAATVRESGRTQMLKLMVLTTRPEEDDRLRALKTGADGLACKTSPPETLLKKVAEVLKSAA